MYLGCPILFTLYNRYPQIRRYSMLVGWTINVAAILGASFATKVSHLIFTQGVLYAIGGAMAHCPAIVFLDEWFVRRKGLAFGVMWGGTSAAGIIFPFAISALLTHYGFRTTLRCYACGLAVIAFPLLYFVKPRLPLSQAYAVRRVDLSFFQSRAFWIPQVGNTLQGLGYFLPAFYLPTYAQDMGLSETNGTMLVALTNAAGVVGAVTVGAMIDRLHFSNVIAICSLGSVIAVFLLWGFAISLPVLVMFSLLYGFFAGSFSSTWSGIVKEVQKKERGVNTGIVIGFLAAGRGVGAVVSGPLGAALFEARSWEGSARWGYGTGYGALMVFTGCSAAAGSLAFVGRRAGMF